jgi:hypothetical protein
VHSRAPPASLRDARHSVVVAVIPGRFARLRN